MYEHKPEFEKPETLTTTQARQGQPSYVFRVLILSVALIIVLFIGAFLLAETDDNDATASTLFTGDKIAEIQLPTIAPNAQFAN